MFTYFGPNLYRNKVRYSQNSIEKVHIDISCFVLSKNNHIYLLENFDDYRRWILSRKEGQNYVKISYKNDDEK
jgi:hypothetical protein